MPGHASLCDREESQIAGPKQGLTYGKWCASVSPRNTRCRPHNDGTDTTTTSRPTSTALVIGRKEGPHDCPPAVRAHHRSRGRQRADGAPARRAPRHGGLPRCTCSDTRDGEKDPAAVRSAVFALVSEAIVKTKSERAPPRPSPAPGSRRRSSRTSRTVRPGATRRSALAEMVYKAIDQQVWSAAKPDYSGPAQKQVGNIGYVLSARGRQGRRRRGLCHQGSRVHPGGLQRTAEGGCQARRRQPRPQPQHGGRPSARARPGPRPRLQARDEGRSECRRERARPPLTAATGNADEQNGAVRRPRGGGRHGRRPTAAYANHVRHHHDH